MREGDAPSQPAGAYRLALTSASACVAESVTYPIDIVKTRLQLQGELHGAAHTAHGAKTAAAAAPPRLGAVHLAATIVRQQGIPGLYMGLTPALLRHVFYTGTRISVYEYLRGSHEPRSQGSVTAGVGRALATGLTAGAVGQAVAVPADLIKVRMQADGRLVAAGAAPRYRGVADAFSQIVRQEGLVGLWRGSIPAVQRAALVNLGELTTYDTAKQGLLRAGAPEGPVAAFGASLCSGLVAALVSTPADVLKTRLMNQDPAKPQYRGMVDCLIKSVRGEGALALWKGFLPTWARLGPWQLVFWVSYEQLRLWSGMVAF